MSRYNQDPDWLPPDERRERQAAAALSSASRRDDRSAYQQDLGEYGTSALQSFNQLVRAKLAASELKDDLFSVESQVRGTFNSMASHVEDCKQAIVDFLNAIPEEEKVFSDNSLLTQLFSDSKKRPANALKTKFSLRYMCLTSIGNHIGSEHWTVDSFNDMLVQSNPHFRDHAAYAFDVFVSAVVSSKGAATNKGVKLMVPYFSGLTDDQFNSLAEKFARFQRSSRVSLQKTAGRRSGQSSARQPVATPVSSSEIPTASTMLPDSPLGGLGPFPGSTSNVHGISGVVDLQVLRNFMKEDHVYSFSHSNDAANPVIDVKDWKKSDEYWTGFADSVESCVGNRFCHNMTVKTIGSVSLPFVTVNYAPVDDHPFQIEVDCAEVVRIIAPHVEKTSFRCNDIHAFSATEQKNAVNIFRAIFFKDMLWIEIQAWSKCGKRSLKEASSSERADSWSSDSLLAELDAVDFTGTYVTADTSLSTASAAAAPAAESSGTVAVVAGGLPDRAPAAGAPSVASVEATHVAVAASTAESDQADAGSALAGDGGDGAESGGMEVETGELSSDPSKRDPKRRRTDDDGAVPGDIMDAISLFDRQYNELRVSLVKTLSDDGHLAELKDNLNQQKVAIDREAEGMNDERFFLENLHDKFLEDKKIIESEMKENRRILTELRQAQAASRERILESQGILQEFCALSTVITEELKDAEETAVESVEICKSIGAAVNRFNGDKTEAERSLNAVKDDLRTKQGEQSELDQRLASLREEVAAAERALEAVQRDEEAAKRRVEAANERIATLQADEGALNIRIGAQNATLEINSSTIRDQKKELDELKEKILKHNVHLRNIQKYKEEFPKMVARMKELDEKEAQLNLREQALLRRSSASVLATPLDSLALSQLGSIHSVAGASGTAGAAGGGSPDDEGLEVGAGDAAKPGSLH